MLHPNHEPRRAALWGRARRGWVAAHVCDVGIEREFATQVSLDQLRDLGAALPATCRVVKANQPANQSIPTSCGTSEQLKRSAPEGGGGRVERPRREGSNRTRERWGQLGTSAAPKAVPTHLRPVTS